VQCFVYRRCLPHHRSNGMWLCQPATLRPSASGVHCRTAEQLCAAARAPCGAAHCVSCSPGAQRPCLLVLACHGSAQGQRSCQHHTCFQACHGMRLWPPAKRDQAAAHLCLNCESWHRPTRREPLSCVGAVGAVGVSCHAAGSGPGRQPHRDMRCRCALLHLSQSTMSPCVTNLAVSVLNKCGSPCSCSLEHLR